MYPLALEIIFVLGLIVVHDNNVVCILWTRREWFIIPSHLHWSSFPVNCKDKYIVTI